MEQLDQYPTEFQCMSQWWSSWTSTPLNSGTCHSDGAVGPVPHWIPAHVWWYGSGSWLWSWLVGSCCGRFCMLTSITCLCGAYLFLYVAFCLVVNAVACCSHLKCTCVWHWIRKCCVLLLCEQCVCVWQQHLHNSCLWCFVNNGWFLVSNLYVCFGLCDNSMLLTRKVSVLELIIHDIQKCLKFSANKKLYNIKTKFIDFGWAKSI